MNRRLPVAASSTMTYSTWLVPLPNLCLEYPSRLFLPSLCLLLLPVFLAIRYFSRSGISIGILHLLDQRYELVVRNWHVVPNVYAYIDLTSRYFPGCVHVPTN